MKRAAVHFGIGRYIYDLDAGFSKLDSYGKVLVKPQLPNWALPGESNPDVVIFNLLQEINESNDSEITNSAMKVIAKFHPNLSKIEKRDIYKELKGLVK